MIDLLFKCLDALDQYLANIKASSDEGTEDNEMIIKELNDFIEKAQGGAVEAPAKAEAVAVEEKTVRLNLTDADKAEVSRAQADGKKVYAVTVYIQKDCLLKAARAFLVYKTLEELGEIIVSVPSAQDIEDEKFEYDFSLIMVSKESAEKAIAAAKSVSEIQEVVGGIVDVPEASAEETKAMELEIAESKAAETGANTPAKAEGAFEVPAANCAFIVL
jgi:two-component system chemotaxis sensor kinase CheA